VENFQSNKENIFSNPENHPILRRFGEVASGRSGETAVFHPDGTPARTFRQIAEGARRWEDILQYEGTVCAGAGAGKVVAVQVGNAPDWPEILLGAWRAGWCVAPMDADLTGSRRDRVEQGCGISRRVVKGSGEIKMEAAAGGGLPVAADLLKLTSGTTGEPRAVCFTAAQLLADCDNVCDTMGLREDDRNYGLVSFAHSYGFSNLVTPLLCRGIPVVTAQDAIPRAVLDGLSASGATVFPGVPAHFRTLSGIGPGPGRLRLCLSAGAPLTGEIARSFLAGWGRKIHSFYGASECGGICYDAGEETDVPAGFVGRPLKGVVVEPVEAGGGAVQVRVRSEAVGTGYFPEQEETLSAGVFRPADLLEDTGKGYVIAGRASDLINVAGRKVNPAEVEAVLRRCPGVTDVVVLGVPAGLRGEEVAACVVGEVRERGLRSFCAGHLGAWQIPRKWIFLPEIPLTSRGKISRAELRSLVLS
jgi:long-chain acyl-CoA synthetase